MITEARTAPATGAAPDDAAPPSPGPGPWVRWRRWRWPLAILAFCVLGGVLIALLIPVPHTNRYLDPASTGPLGSHALTDILAERGYQVASAYSVAGAVADAGRGGSGQGTAAIVVTSPGLLTARQRMSLARSPAELILVGPGPAALAALAPGTRFAGIRVADGPIPPACGLTAARLAGTADIGGRTYRPPAGAAGCYPIGGHPALVRYAAAGRTITIVGTGLPFTNAMLASDGNAALALNLLSANRRIVWLVPQRAGGVAGPAPAHPTAPPLISRTAWLVVLQLAVAVLLAAIWRARRFGPLIAERLPVIVRASETVQGHGRLYRARRARDRAAAILRDAMLDRVRPVLGLPADAPATAVVQALTARTGRAEQAVTEIVYGPVPASDADLVRMTRNLDDLEREVRAR